MGKYKYYAVWSGRKTGIFYTYNECEIQVKNFPGNGYKGTNSLNEANKLVENGLEQKLKPLDLSESKTDHEETGWGDLPFNEIDGDDVNGDDDDYPF